MRPFLAHPFDDDKLKEECGVFGVIGVTDAANFVALGLHALQHRGQEAGGIDQGLGFLFGVLRGVLLVGIAFLVYDRALASAAIPMVDDSRSAKVFASFQSAIDAAVPENAPNWIVDRYKDLTAACEPPSDAPANGAVPAKPETPATPEAPAING